VQQPSGCAAPPKTTTAHAVHYSILRDESFSKPIFDSFVKCQLALITTPAAYARARGIIIADTKFEFGLDEQGRLQLIDELLTPDSSRFWPADQYSPGTSPPSFDKQFVRDWLESQAWNKTPPAPTLPDEVVQHTLEKYQEAQRLLTA